MVCAQTQREGTYVANGQTIPAVTAAMLDHRAFVHGVGMTDDTHRLLREAYADR